MFSKIRGAWCMLASPADVLRGSSHVPAPLDQSQQTFFFFFFFFLI